MFALDIWCSLQKLQPVPKSHPIEGTNTLKLSQHLLCPETDQFKHIASSFTGCSKHRKYDVKVAESHSLEKLVDNCCMVLYLLKGIM